MLVKLDEFDTDLVADALVRLRRIQGQIGGLIRMIESGRECEEVVGQISAASKALDRVGFKLVVGGLRHCVREGETPEARRTERQLERLFLLLA